MPTAETVVPNETTTVESVVEPVVNPDVSSYADVKYYSQLDKETATNTDVMDRVKGFKSVSDLAKGYADLSRKADNALQIPTKDSSVDEIKAYFKKLGVPDDAEGYNLEDGDYEAESIRELKENFRKQVLYRNGLTKHQGEAVWNACREMLKAERDANVKAFEEARKSFGERHDALLRQQYPVEADRKAAMNEDMDLVAEFFADTGLGQTFKQLGLVYNPDVIHRLAQYHKATRAKGVMGKGGETKEDTGLFKMSADFAKAYGGR